MMTLAAYCRVSSRHQKADSQIAEIEKWLAAHGYDAQQVRWHVDKKTGKTLKRSEFEWLQRDIFSGNVGTVIVTAKESLTLVQFMDPVSVPRSWRRM
jgi:DNA invertase Pin-like site-specific DNA recombinase